MSTGFSFILQKNQRHAIINSKGGDFSCRCVRFLFYRLTIVCRLFSIPVYVECAFLLAIPGLQLLFAGQHPDYFVRTDYRLVRVNRLAEQKTIVPDSVPLVREDGSVNVPQLIFQLGQMLPIIFVFLFYLGLHRDTTFVIFLVLIWNCVAGIAVIFQAKKNFK